METAVPREKLKELMEKNGEGLLQDRDRCEGLLKDYCGGHRREISAIVGALEERVPLELRSSWQTAMTPEAMREDYLLYKRDRFIMTEQRVLDAIAAENLEPSRKSLADYYAGTNCATLP